VDDLESEYRRLIKKGVPFNTEPQDFVSVKVTYCRDPDGNIIELMERAKGYPNPIVGVIATGDAPPKR
jgi:predicted enzyme related to lactoylglutathione lyase